MESKTWFVIHQTIKVLVLDGQLSIKRNYNKIAKKNLMVSRILEALATAVAYGLLVTILETQKRHFFHCYDRIARRAPTQRDKRSTC